MQKSLFPSIEKIFDPLSTYFLKLSEVCEVSNEFFFQSQMKH